MSGLFAALYDRLFRPREYREGLMLAQENCRAVEGYYWQAMRERARLGYSPIPLSEWVLEVVRNYTQAATTRKDS